MIPRRTVLLSAATLLAAGLPPGLSAHAAPGAVLTPGDRTDLARIEAWLNGLHTLKAHFVQVAQDGGMSQGTAWLERPGRMRFQYDPPAPFLLVASHGVLTFHDSKLDQTTKIALDRTPLGILLADHVQLSGAVTVTGMEALPGQLQVTLVRTASPGDGSLTLFFADSPLMLRQWIVVDAQRRETRVTLTDIQLGGTFNPQLFEQIGPMNGKQG